MLWLEIVAAGLVGLALCVLVLAPLVERSPITGGDDEPEDLEETEHGIALAALKEIEFDRATGKLSDEDYAFLKRKYTGNALEALRAAEVSGGPNGGMPDVDEIIAARASTLLPTATHPLTCPRCGPRPEADALFCSSCGTRLRVQTGE